MPGGDRTGPLGAGPMTGGGFGYCGGTSYSRGGFGGRQGGFGRGGGRGWRNRFWATGRLRRGDWDEPVAPWSADAERQNLQEETAAIEAELRRLKARIEELETTNSD
jgi:hypothetical protein